MKVCLDSNVIISAFATRGLAADVMRVVLVEHELIVPAVVLAEVIRVLRDKFGVPTATLHGVERLLRSQTVVPQARDTPPYEVRDASDAWVLAGAVAGDADVLVTGDHDLLDLGKDAPLPIVSPRAFWEQLRGAT